MLPLCPNILLNINHNFTSCFILILRNGQYVLTTYELIIYHWTLSAIIKSMTLIGLESKIAPLQLTYVYHLGLLLNDMRLIKA